MSYLPNNIRVTIDELVFVDLFLGIWPIDARGMFLSMCVTLDSSSLMTFIITYWIQFKLVQQQIVAFSLNGSFLAAYSTNGQAKSKRYNCIQYLAPEYGGYHWRDTQTTPKVNDMFWVSFWKAVWLCSLVFDALNRPKKHRRNKHGL